MALCNGFTNIKWYLLNHFPLFVVGFVPGLCSVPRLFLFKKPAFDFDWLFYFERRSFAEFNNTDKIIYNVSEG